MEPTQLLAYESSRNARRALYEALPAAPAVQDDGPVGGLSAARSRLAALLRRTADRLEPCPPAAV